MTSLGRRPELVICMSMHARACGGYVSTLNILLLATMHLVFLQQHPSLGPGACQLGYLAGHQAPGILLSSLGLGLQACHQVWLLMYMLGSNSIILRIKMYSLGM